MKPANFPHYARNFLVQISRGRYSLTQTRSNRNTLSKNERGNGLQLHVVTNAFWSLVTNPVKKEKKKKKRQRVSDFEAISGENGLLSSVIVLSKLIIL